jgi:excisionase family DNA binding protein
MNTATPTPNQEAIQLEQLPEVMTADEVARLLRVSRKTVYTTFKKGEIPGGRKLGSALRFSRSRVLQWLAEGQERGSRSPRGVR